MDVEELRLSRPPLWNRKGKQTILFVTGTIQTIERLRTRKGLRGGAVHCPLTKAWMSFPGKDEMLRSDLRNLDISPLSSEEANGQSGMDFTDTSNTKSGADVVTPKSSRQHTDLEEA